MTQPATGRPAGEVAVRSRRFMALLESSNLLSGVGHGITGVALPWLVLERTGSPGCRRRRRCGDCRPLVAVALLSGTVVGLSYLNGPGRAGVLIAAVGASGTLVGTGTAFVVAAACAALLRGLPGSGRPDSATKPDGLWRGTARVLGSSGGSASCDPSPSWSCSSSRSTTRSRA